MHAGLEGIARFQHPLTRQGQAHLGQPVEEAMGALACGTAIARTGNHRDIAVAEREQVARCRGCTVAIVGDHGLCLVIRHMRVDADVAAFDAVEHLRQRCRLGGTRAQDHAVQLLLLHEAAHAVRAVRRLAVAGMHDQLIAGAAQRFQRAVLQVDNALGARVVIHQADQEGAAERETARQGVGHVTDLAHQRLDLVAGVFAHQRRVVDDS